MSVILQLIPLDESFAQFGDVIEVAETAAGSAINDGTCLRFDDLARIDVDQADTAALSIFRAQPRVLPLPIRALERHPLGSQAFVPLRPSRFVVVVAAGEQPLASAAKAFLATSGQGVNIHRNVWHHSLIVLDLETDFLVIDRVASEASCEVRKYAGEVQIGL